jgi:uncharacterized protein (TIGR03083 family)
MTVQTTVDHEALTWSEVDDIGALLHELEPDEWDQPSLCEGWRVRDVIGHMGYGHTTPMGPIVLQVIKYKGNMTKGSFELSKRFATERTPAELLELWDRELVGAHARRGIAKTIKWPEAYLDHFIHHQDIRRPLDRPRDIAEERLVAALEVIPTVKTPLFATKPVVDGLRLRATDLDVSIGDGAPVEGPAEALVLAAAGRRVALAELSGEGLETFRARVGA